MTTISVAMATYNGEAFVLPQLESIAKQTRPPDELIITDDGSTDRTIEIVETFARSAPFEVHIHRNERRLGYRANFMFAFSLCKSDLIAVCDQDDLWDARKLEVAHTAFTNPDVLLFFHDAWLIDADGRRRGEANIIKLPPLNQPLSFYPLVNPLGFSIVFRRVLLSFSKYWKHSFDTWEPSNRMAHDQWLSFLSSVYGVIAASDLKLVDYRQHGRNTYGWHTPSLWRRYKHNFQNNSHSYLMLSSVAEARADLLDLSGPDLSSAWKIRALTGAIMYRQLAARLFLRSRIYGTESLNSRLTALIVLIKQGAYAGASPWKFGPMVLLKDVVLGFIFRRLLRAPTANRIAQPSDDVEPRQRLFSDQTDSP